MLLIYCSDILQQLGGIDIEFLQYADDTKFFFKKITSEYDIITLQWGIDSLHKWSLNNLHKANTGIWRYHLVIESQL